MKTKLIICLVAALISGCKLLQSDANSRSENENREIETVATRQNTRRQVAYEAYFQNRPNCQFADQIRRSRVAVGMDEEQVVLSWGQPDSIHKSVGIWGTHSQWVYRANGQYLYFENGKVTSWQSEEIVIPNRLIE